MATVRATARRYAEAVFATAQEAQSFDAWVAELERVVQVLADPSARRLLTSPAVPAENRRQALDRLLPELGPQARKLVHLLVEWSRLELAPEILAALRGLVDQARGLVTAEVTSAVELDAELRRVVAERLARFTGKQVQLELSIDPDLIGGIVARVGDELIDDSVRGHLLRLKQRLAQAPVS